MAGSMVDALWITLIGMGLVFVAILLLWGLMALLVRLTAERGEVGREAEPPAEAPAERMPDGSSPAALKRRAAAAAVAFALAAQKPAASTTTTRRPSEAAVSPWQVAHRANQLGRPASPTRKQVDR